MSKVLDVAAILIVAALVLGAIFFILWAAIFGDGFFRYAATFVIIFGTAGWAVDRVNRIR